MTSRASSATAVTRATYSSPKTTTALPPDVHNTLELLLTRMSRALVQHRNCEQLARDDGAVYQALAELFTVWSARQASAAALRVSPSCLSFVVRWCITQLTASPHFTRLTEVVEDEVRMTAVIDTLVVAQTEVQHVFAHAVNATEKESDVVGASLPAANQCEKELTKTQSLQAVLDLCRRMGGSVAAEPCGVVRYVHFTAAVATLVPAIDLRELITIVARSIEQTSERQNDACAADTEGWLMAAICRSWATVDTRHAAALRELASLLLQSASQSDGSAVLLERIAAAWRQPTLRDHLACHGTDPVLSLDLPGQAVEGAAGQIRNREHAACTAG